MIQQESIGEECTCQIDVMSQKIAANHCDSINAQILAAWIVEC